MLKVFKKHFKQDCLNIVKNVHMCGIENGIENDARVCLRLTNV
jgi:hypothetical protein